MHKLKFKGFVSILGLAVVIGVALTYITLINYLRSSTELKDPFINQIFGDINKIEKYELENIKYILYSKDYILKDVNHDLEQKGMFCTLGSYKYNHIKVYDGTYIIAEVDENGVSINPLLIKSNVVSSKQYKVSSSSKGIVVLSNPQDSLEIAGCEYERVYDKTYNQYIHILAINVLRGDCILQSTYPFTINEYSTFIDKRFIQFNLLGLINNVDIPIQFLALPKEKLNFFVSNLQNLINKRFGEVQNLLNYDISNIPDYERVQEKIEGIMFLKDKVREEVINEISSLNEEERKVLYNALSLQGDIKENLENALSSQPINERSRQKLKKIVETIEKANNNVDLFFYGDLKNIISKYTNIDEIFTHVQSLNENEKEILSRLLDKYSLEEISSWDDTTLTNKIEEEIESSDIKGVNLPSLKEHIVIFKNLGVKGKDLKEIMSFDYNTMDVSFANRVDGYVSQLYSLEEINNAYKSCVEIKKYKKLMDLMDITSITFSPQYDVKTSYERMDNFGILKNSIKGIDVNKIKDVDSLLNEMGLDKEEINKAKDILLKGEIKSVKDLKKMLDLYNQLKKQDYVAVLNKMISYNKLSDTLLEQITSSIYASFGLNIVIEVCNNVAYTQNLFDFNTAIEGYSLLKQGFDPERIMAISLSKNLAFKYGDIIQKMNDLKDIDLVDIKSCSKLLDVKKVLLSLIYMSQQYKDTNPDYLSSCFYAHYVDTKYNAYIYNSSSNLGIYMFKSPLAKKFESYNIIYHPYYAINSSYSVFKEYDEAIKKLNENSNVLIEIRNKIKERITHLKENEFEFEQLKCGKCDFAPNPLKRTKNDELKDIVNNILKEYKDKISLTVKDVEVKEDVKDLSQKIYTGCTCSKKGINLAPLYLCKTHYKVNRGGNIYLLYSYKNMRFIIEIKI